MNVTICFLGGKELSLNSLNIIEVDLRLLVSWFKGKNGSEVKTLGYNMNGTTGEYMFSRKSIAYIKTQEK